MDDVKSTGDLEAIAAAIKGRTISSVELPGDELHDGAFLVLELSGGLRLYLDAPTLYGDTDTPAPITSYGPPPEGLEDAWERYQHGGNVDEADARKLDEWRADVEREAFGGVGLELSEDARRVIAGLLDPEQETSEVTAVDTTWDEIREAFPARDDGYPDPSAD